MLFPYPVLDHLTPTQAQVWHTHFAGRGFERPRSIEEGIWRRTQNTTNRSLSGWEAGADGRRWVVHYRYQYELDHTFPVPRLVLAQLYLAYSITAPTDELVDYATRIDTWLEQGRWRRTLHGWVRGDLTVRVDRYEDHPQDVRAGRATPPGFASLDVCLTSEGADVPRPVRNLPWDVLARGPRVPDQRGKPAYAPDLSALLDHAPFQVELGCGPSIEAGIPPLHFLHQVYRVTQRDDDSLTQRHAFTMRPGQDTLIRELLVDPEAKAAELTRMFAAVLTAEPTPAHHALAALADARLLTGPVINHSFDVLPARAGLAEQFVRRYDQKFPEVEWGEGVKALLVIGLHADRRAVQARARERGLPVFYVDTEGLDEHGVFREYLIEGARQGDTIVRQAATPALEQLCELAGVSVPETGRQAA